MGLWTRVRLPPNPLEKEVKNRIFMRFLYYASSDKNTVFAQVFEGYRNNLRNLQSVFLIVIQGVVIMADQSIFVVDGYRFGSAEDAELARNELKKIQHFEDKLDGRNAQTLLAVYDKLMDEKIFSTPVGWEYLRKLQEKLNRAGIAKERIRPIPMYVVFAHKTEKEGSVFDRIRPTRKKSRDKKNLRISLGVNVLLTALVIAMFIITLTGENPNILNYKKAITDQYASWEQELAEREEMLREKEAELMLETLEKP